MTDEQQTTSVTGEAVDNTDYIAAIKELKENSVDRSKYEALRADNKRLLDSLVNGQTIDLPAAETKQDLGELRKAVFETENQTNLEYVKNALALRKALIENGETDPFIPHGTKFIPSDEDIAKAEKVAQIFQECVDYADGDSNAFTNELMRRTVDTGPVRKKK